jgi:DNA invertase Pin-like site-specific DNA recombinase
MQAALAAAQAGEFDVLLVYRIDRLTRFIVGLMTIVETLDAAGVALRSATEPIDTQGPVGRMLLQLLGIFAEFERSLLIDRISKGFERKAARGEWLAGPGPFGYRADPATKTLTVDPAEAPVVQAMFAAYVEERLGATALANRLNDTGQRNRNDRLWSNQTILRVLRNPVYVGKISHGDDLYDGKHAPIIDADLFDEAQKLLAERAAESATIAPTLSEYLLSGKLRCRACGGAYVGVGAHGRGGFSRLDELTIHHKRLAAELRTVTPQIPGPDELRRLVAKIKRAITKSPDVVKQMFEGLIDRVEITPDLHAYPYFYVPDMDKPGPLLARACNRTPVRMGSHHVEVAGIEPASSSASPGLLRAQLALLFSAPAITQARRRQAQPLFDVPPGPATGSGGDPSS